MKNTYDMNYFEPKVNIYFSDSLDFKQSFTLKRQLIKKITNVISILGIF